MVSMAILDCDSHLFESRTTWRDYIDPGMRDAALAIEDDELGWPWLTWRGQRLYPVESQVPGDAAVIGRERTRRAEGLAPLERYDDLVPAHYTDAVARAARIEAWGLDASVVFPNFGLIWEDMLAADRPALLANLRAANRWMANAVADGNGRLLGAGWVPMFLLNIDGANDFYVLRHGPLYPLPSRPSEYFLRHVRVGALAYERPDKLIRQLGDNTFMFGSDWPHAEGIADPVGDYERHVADRLTDTARSQLFGGNLSWLLGARATQTGQAPRRV